MGSPLSQMWGKGLLLLELSPGRLIAHYVEKAQGSEREQSLVSIKGSGFQEAINHIT